MFNFAKYLLISTLVMFPLDVKAQNSSQALQDCKTLISTFLGDPTLARIIPDVVDNGDSKEFIFGWPTGTLNFGSFRGTRGKSASCTGSYDDGVPKVEYVTINGKSVL